MSGKKTYLKSKGVLKKFFVGEDENTGCFTARMWFKTPQYPDLLFGDFVLDNKPRNGERYRRLGRDGIEFLFNICEIFGFEDNCNFNFLLEKECEVILKKEERMWGWYSIVAIGNSGKWFNPTVFFGGEQYVLRGSRDYSSIYEKMETGKEYKIYTLGRYDKGRIKCTIEEVENEHSA